MPYIYKYTDKEDGIVKYVGIIKSDNNFPRRFNQHSYSDEWCFSKDWDIEYCYFGSVSDVEVLEGHFITLYHTTEWYNKAKAGWGLCSFAPDVKWIAYEGCKENPCGEKCLIEQIQLKLDIEAARHELNSLYQRLNYLDKRLDRERRKDVREWYRTWFANGINFWDQSVKAEDLYAHYEEHASRGSYIFDDKEDFWDAMCRLPELRHYVFEDHMCGITMIRHGKGETDEIRIYKNA